MSTTTREDLKRWFEKGANGVNTHMVVIQDTFDYGCYVNYIEAHKQSHVEEVLAILRKQPMTRIMEIYAYHLPFAFQVEYQQAWFPETDPYVDPTSNLHIPRQS